MKIERLRELPHAPDGAGPGAPAGPAVVAVGNFDGVHRGHRMGLQLAREEAQGRGAECVAVTFDPHPARLLRPDRAPKTITSFALKAERLAAAGVERLVVLEFGEAMARTSPARFRVPAARGAARSRHRGAGCELPVRPRPRGRSRDPPRPRRPPRIPGRRGAVRLVRGSDPFLPPGSGGHWPRGTSKRAPRSSEPSTRSMARWFRAGAGARGSGFPPQTWRPKGTCWFRMGFMRWMRR